MRSRAAEANAVDVSRDPTRMLTKFELPRPSAEPPAPLESGTHEIDRTAIMRPYESVKLLAASLPTPYEAMKPVPLPHVVEEEVPPSEPHRSSELPTMPGLPAEPAEPALPPLPTRSQFS